jgi:integrase
MQALDEWRSKTSLLPMSKPSTGTVWIADSRQPQCHKALSQAVKWSLIPRNVTEDVKAPRSVPEEIRPLDREQTKTLLEAAQGDRFEALYALAVTTGLRQGELLGLRWDDLDLAQDPLRVKRTLTRRKGHLLLGESPRPRRAAGPLTDTAVEALRGHLTRQMEQI